MPSAARTTRWAGVPPADRTAERRALLLDAAFDLLGTEGMAGTTVRAVCQSARLNPRYFYESFDDLDALVVAVFDRLVSQLRDEIEVAVAAAGPAPRDQVRATVETTTRWVDEDRRRARVLYVEALGNEALNRRRIETGFAIAGFVEARGKAPKGDHIGQVTAAILVGGFSELLMGWLDGRIRVSRRQLVDDATELFVALGDAAARIAGGRERPMA